MSFDVPVHQPPTTETTTRDAVSDLSAPRDSTGPSKANLVQASPPTSAPALPGPGSKKRKAYKVTKPSRSLSTPHVRGVIMSDAESDKKRNKLGYQRISIACAHCRRRKIRCLVAEGDPRGRCQNCIRLKKECAFYPVDQQGVIETTSQPSSASASGIASGDPSRSAVSSSTPPDPDPTNLPNQPAFQTIPSNVPSDFDGLSRYPVDPNAPFANHQHYPESVRYNQRVFDPSAGAMSQAGPGLRQQPDTHSPWIGAGGFQYQQSGVQSPDYHNSQYWRQNTAHSGPDYASYPVDQMSPPSIPQSAHPFAFSPQRLDEMWTQAPPQQPVRSMSYGQIEGFPQGMDPYSHFAQPGMHTSSMTRHGPSGLEVQNASMMPPGPQSAPLRQEYAVFPDQQQFGMQQGNRLPKSLPSTTNPTYSVSHYHQSPHLAMGEGEQHIPMSEPGSYAVHPNQPG